MTKTYRTIDSGSSDADVADFLAWVKADAPADEAVAADLAAVFARSGATFRSTGGVTADVASTGGPSSLSTLLCPLYLRAGGLIVPKLGVPGRPAGGVDCLAQVQGYRIELGEDELKSAIRASGYAHFVASGRYAPLDARVFKLRQQHNAQEVPTLVAASLLSKKLAVGVQRAGLDVRVAPHGNFGRTWDDARANAALFVRAASRHGVRAFPVLTDAAFPYQPFIGRSEALLALATLFQSNADAWLESHKHLCRQLSVAVAPADLRPSIYRATASELKHHFLANLDAQGASEQAFDMAVRSCESGHTHTLCAVSDGFTSYSLEQIRRIFVKHQESAAATVTSGFPDPLGIVLLQEPGEWVAQGQPLATARIDTTLDTAQVLRELESALCRPGCQPHGQGIEGLDEHE